MSARGPAVELPNSCTSCALPCPCARCADQAWARTLLPVWCATQRPGMHPTSAVRASQRPGLPGGTMYQGRAVAASSSWIWCRICGRGATAGSAAHPSAALLTRALLTRARRPPSMDRVGGQHRQAPWAAPGGGWAAATGFRGPEPGMCPEAGGRLARWCTSSVSSWCLGACCIGACCMRQHGHAPSPPAACHGPHPAAPPRFQRAAAAAAGDGRRPQQRQHLISSLQGCRRLRIRGHHGGAHTEAGSRRPRAC